LSVLTWLRPAGKQEPSLFASVSKETLSLQDRIENLVRNGVLEEERKNARPLPPPLPVEEGLAPSRIRFGPFGGQSTLWRR